MSTSRVRELTAAVQVDPFAGLMRVRRLLTKLTGHLDPSQRLMQKTAQKLVGCRLSAACAQPGTLALLIVRLEDAVRDHVASAPSDDSSAP